MKNVLALVILTLFVTAGCSRASGGTNVEPTPTNPVATSTSTDIIMDGPWASLPENSETGLTIDPELKAITLQTDPTNLVYVTQPDPTKDAYTNSIYYLGEYQGHLYLGYGDMTNNQGPVGIVSYDPSTGTLLREMDDIPEEILGTWNVGENGEFFASGADSREPWTFGNFYFTDGFGWRKVRTIYRGLHVMGIVEFQGRLYAEFRSDGKLSVGYPFILVSSNGGITWEYERLAEDTSQDTYISQLVVIHHNSADMLCAIAEITNPNEPENRLYCFDGKTWQRQNLKTPEGDYMPRDIYGFGESIIINGYSDFQTFTWDGQTMTEIPYFKGHYMSFNTFIENDGWLYALVPMDGLTTLFPTSTLVRTRDLKEWEELGTVALPVSVTPQAMIFSHNRLYLGAQNSLREITGTSRMYKFEVTRVEPLADATLTWDADIPIGASLSFQIKTGKNWENYEEYMAYKNSPFIGPDGTSNSAYTIMGQALPAIQQSATLFQVTMSRTPNSSGELPFVRSITLHSSNSSTTYSVDVGSGLYTAANRSSISTFTSAIFALGAPLSGGSISFDTHTPENTDVTFQIRTGHTRDELENTAFVGPDGTENSFYTLSGSPIWEGSEGSLFIQYRALLSSDNPDVAPFLRQVTLVTRKGVLDHLDVSLKEVGPWTAGESHPIQITARSMDGQLVAVSGEVPLIVKSQTQEGTSLLSPQFVQLTNGEASVNVSLYQAGPSQICVEITGTVSCSEEVDVQAAAADWLRVEAPDLFIPSPYISPHTDVGKVFSIVVTAMDHFNNIVRDYTGTIHCEIWKWEATDPLAVPAYSFTATDIGSHRFESALSFTNAGEYSLVCLDDTNPQIGGALAITAGEFNQDIFP
jgi:hypothetical protein